MNRKQIEQLAEKKGLVLREGGARGQYYFTKAISVIVHQTVKKPNNTVPFFSLSEAEKFLKDLDPERVEVYPYYSRQLPK